MSLLSEWDSSYAQMRSNFVAQKAAVEAEKTTLEAEKAELDAIPSPDSTIQGVINRLSNQITRKTNRITEIDSYITEIDIVHPSEDRTVIDNIIQCLGVNSITRVQLHVIRNGLTGIKNAHDTYSGLGLCGENMCRIYNQFI